MANNIHNIPIVTNDVTWCVLFPATLYVSCIAGSVMVNGAIPLFFEMTCETSYPIGEGVTTGLLTLLLNLSGSIFLGVSQIPGIGRILSTVFSTILSILLHNFNYFRPAVNINLHRL
jgi:hypothetical protein